MARGVHWVECKRVRLEEAVKEETRLPIELMILACLWKVLNVGLLDVSGKIVEGRQKLDARGRTLDS